MLKQLAKEDDKNSWARNRRTGKKTRHFGTFCMPEKYTLTKHHSHSITSTMNLLRTGHNGWRGHPPYYAHTNKSMSAAQKQEAQERAMQKRTCQLCDTKQNMTAQHVFCGCKHREIRLARRTMNNRLSKFRKISRTNITRLEWYLNEEEWDHKEEGRKLSITQKRAIMQIIHEFTLKIRPLTGSLHYRDKG